MHFGLSGLHRPSWPSKQNNYKKWQKSNHVLLFMICDKTCNPLNNFFLLLLLVYIQICGNVFSWFPIQKYCARARERERDFHYLKHMELNIREIQWFHFNLSFLFSDYYRQMCWKKMTERIWKINRLYIILIIPQITHSCILLIKVYTMTKRECSTYDPLLSLMNMHVVLIILSTTTKS